MAKPRNPTYVISIYILQSADVPRYMYGTTKYCSTDFCAETSERPAPRPCWGRPLQTATRRASHPAEVQRPLQSPTNRKASECALLHSAHS